MVALIACCSFMRAAESNASGALVEAGIEVALGKPVDAATLYCCCCCCRGGGGGGRACC